MVLKWISASSVPDVSLKFSDADAVRENADGSFTFINPYKMYESKPCVVIGTDKLDGKRGLHSAIYCVWSFVDATGEEIRRETAWIDYLTEEIEIEVEKYVPYSIIFKEEQ